MREKQRSSHGWKLPSTREEHERSMESALWRLSLALKEIAQGPIMDAEKKRPPGQPPGEDALLGGGEESNAHAPGGPR